MVIFPHAGAFEEGYVDDHRATFVHGVFDDVPIGFTELANAPDWLPLYVLLNGERFSLSSGRVKSYERRLDLRSGIFNSHSSLAFASWTCCHPHL